MSVLRKFPLLTRFVLVLGLPFAAALIWFAHVLEQTLPPSGQLSMKGVAQQVDIVRDSSGVPAVTARSDRDAYFTVGVLHAQDRLWQLEVLRRTVRGTLSEVLGRQALQRDLWFRSIDLPAAAREALPSLSAEAQASLNSYAEGVNAGVRSARRLPPEFLALGIEPEPWSAVDSLAVMKMFAFEMSSSFRNELRNSVARSLLGDDLLKVLLPAYATSELFDPTQNRLPADSSTLGLTAFVQKNAIGATRYAGSNAWALSGRVTSSGRTLLANDPHLRLQIPSPWYAVSIASPQLTVSGVGLVGAPVVIFGSNASIAWGITNLPADTQDLYFERVDRATPTRYEALGSWLDFDLRTEQIAIREDAPRVLNRAYKPMTRQFRKSVNGPVINDYAGFAAQPLALMWAGFNPADTSYEAFFRLGYSRDWTEFRDALSRLVTPTLNFVYADRVGNIGYQGAGRVPVRNSGTGALPVEATRRDYFWKGYVSFEEMPRVYNPERGYLVSANDRVETLGRSQFLSYDWASESRHDRIEMLLSVKHAGKLSSPDAQSMQALQRDTVDLAARRLLPRLMQTKTGDAASIAALEYLRKWDGDMSTSSVAGSIFQTWMRHLKKALLEDDLQSAVGSEHIPPVLTDLLDNLDLGTVADLLSGADPVWCDDKRTQQKESCDDILKASLEDAVKELTQLAGSDMERWSWGRLHYAHYDAISLFADPVLSALFSRRVPSAGSPDTVNVADAVFVEGERADGSEIYAQHSGANFRQIVTFDGKSKEQLFIGMTGQSDNRVSDHYDDMIGAFQDGSYDSIGTHEPGERISRLTLVPAH